LGDSKELGKLKKSSSLPRGGGIAEEVLLFPRQGSKMNLPNKIIRIKKFDLLILFIIAFLFGMLLGIVLLFGAIL